MIVNRGPFRRQGMAEYVNRMSKPRTKPIYDNRMVALMSKIGVKILRDPQSIYDPDQLYEALKVYGEKPTFWRDCFIERAFSKALAVFGYRDTMPKLVPLKQVTQDLVKLDRSAGIYLMSKAEAFPVAERRAKDILNGTKKPNPCIAFARTQKGNKTRLVWGYPLDMTLLESRFGVQLIEKFKTIRTPITYSLRRYELGARLAATIRARYSLSLDFSKFDSTLSSEVITMAFKILKTWFQMDEEDERAWKIVTDYFIRTSIVMPDGHLYTGKNHGVPSGSLFTQLIDSISNFLISQAVFLSCGIFVPTECHHVLGDDSVVSTNSDINLHDLRRAFKRYGLNLNMEKSKISTPEEGFEYLGTHWKDGLPNVTVEKIVRSATQPEKWRKYAYDDLTAHSQMMSIILSLCSLGLNGWEIAKRFVHYPNISGLSTCWRQDPHFLTGYQRYRLQESPSSIWFNIDTGIFV